MPISEATGHLDEVAEESAATGEKGSPEGI